jgi:nickel-dependent lactate racemase
MIEAARLAKVDFILNVVTNSKNELVQAFAGDVEQAFLEGTKLVDEMYKLSINQRANIVVVSAGGYPHDINLYQASKALQNALDAVKRNGIIILVAECPEGHGNEAFAEWMEKYTDVRRLEREIKRNFVLGGHKAYFINKALQKVTIILVSVMPDTYAVNIFKMRTSSAMNDAMRDAFEIAGKNAKVYVMSHGKETVAQYQSPDQNDE